MGDDDSALRALGDAHGVHRNYFDLHGHEHTTSVPTYRALLHGLGVEAATRAEVANSLDRENAEQQARVLPRVVVAFAQKRVDLLDPGRCESWELTDEDGAEQANGLGAKGIVLPALSPGYYNLRIKVAGQTQRSLILIRPQRAPSLPEIAGQDAGWGFVGALYGMAGSGGVGNYSDLAAAGRGLAQTGAHFLGINPVHALGWAAEHMISPYSPSHRGFWNIDHVAPAGGVQVNKTAALIDYADHRAAQRAALEAEYSSLTEPDQKAFKTWLSDADVLHFAEFEALSERYGRNPRDWPAKIRSPGKAASQTAGPRAEFHAWLQYKAEVQLHSAHQTTTANGMPLGLYLDLAVGARPDGAEVWMNPDTIARGVTIGAPPDHLSPEGQSWALAAHAPGPLAQQDFRPLRQMLSKLMQTCGLLRIDHALGLMRSFWLPDDGSPGGYISQPFDALLAVLLIEADRSGCILVGEDLGLVPDGFRTALHKAGLLSYAVWQYETEADGALLTPDHLPVQSLACFATHDTPTLAGFWYGTDIEWWRDLGWLNTSQHTQQHARRSRQRQSLRKICNLYPMAPAKDTVRAVHKTLAQSPATLVAVQLDDVLGLTEAQNIPGTIDEHPNWRRPLPANIEDVAQMPGLQELRALLPEHRHAKQPHDRKIS